jgi:hypothetical protein
MIFNRLTAAHSQPNARDLRQGNGGAVVGPELRRPADDSRRRVAAMALRVDGSSRGFNARQFT